MERGGLEFEEPLTSYHACNPMSVVPNLRGAGKKALVAGGVLAVIGVGVVTVSSMQGSGESEADALVQNTPAGCAAVRDCMEPKVESHVTNSDVKEYIQCQFNCMDDECHTDTKNGTSATLCVAHKCLPKLDKCLQNPDCMQQLRGVKEAIHDAEEQCCPDGHCAQPYGEVVNMPRDKKEELIHSDPAVNTMFNPTEDDCEVVSACMREETASSDEIMAGYMECQFDCMQSNCKSGHDANKCVMDNCMAELVDCPKSKECMLAFQGMKPRIQAAKQKCCAGGKCDDEPYKTVLATTAEQKKAMIENSDVLAAFEKNLAAMSVVADDGNCTKATACMKPKVLDGLTDQQVQTYVECQFECMKNECDSGNSTKAFFCEVQTCMPILQDCPEQSKCAEEVKTMKARIAKAEDTCCPNGSCGQPYKGLMSISRKDKEVMMATAAYEVVDHKVENDNCTKATKCMQPKVMQGVTDENVQKYVECQFQCMSHECSSGNSTRAFFCEVQTCMPLIQDCGEQSKCAEEVKTLKARITKAEDACCPDGSCGQPYKGLMSISRKDKEVMMATAAYEVVDHRVENDNCTKATQCMRPKVENGIEDVQVQKYIECQFGCMQKECSAGNSSRAFFCEVQTCLPILEHCQDRSQCATEVRTLKAKIANAEEQCCPNGSCGKPYSTLMSMSHEDKEVMLATAAYAGLAKTLPTNCSKTTECMEKEVQPEQATTKQFMKCQFACMEAECDRGVAANATHAEKCVVDTCMSILQDCSKEVGCMEGIEKLHDSIQAAEAKCCPDGSCGKPYGEMMAMTMEQKEALVMTNTKVVETFEQEFVM